MNHHIFYLLHTTTIKIASINY